MAKVVIWHNPRCSKSRQTLELIKSRGISPQIVKYLETPPTAEEIRTALSLSGLSAKQLVRSDEPLYKSLIADRAELTADELVELMARHPALIERPLVIVGEHAALGRPPEAVLPLLA